MELTPELKKKYGIIKTWNRVSAIDNLFNDGWHDPYFAAHSDASDLSGGKPFTIAVALTRPKIMCYIGGEPKGWCCVTTQIIVFRDENGLREYISDGVTIFENKDI